jgi:alkylated DNA repair protein (DNA oxidative demethylase)
MMPDLFDDPAETESRRLPLAPGAVLLRGRALATEEQVLAAIGRVVEAAPFRHMVTPGGYRMSVAMTNCGAAGWLTDRNGYRYDAIDPESGGRWPPMPSIFADLAGAAAAEAGFDGFVPPTPA